MDGPQVENGFTRIANELLEAICAHDFSGREMKILFTVIRQTYGYQTKLKPLSVREIALACNIIPCNAYKTVEDLVQKNVLMRVSTGEVKRGQNVHAYGINKRHSEWLRPVSKRYQYQNDTSIKTIPGPVSKQYSNQYQNDTAYIRKKERKKEKKDEHVFFAPFWQEYPNKKSKPAALKVFERIDPDEALLREMLNALLAQKADRANRVASGAWVPEWKHPATWLNNRCWEDEIGTPERKTGDWTDCLI